MGGGACLLWLTAESIPTPTPIYFRRGPMDLSYGKEYDELRAEARSFLAENWPPQGDLPREEGGE